MKPLRLVLDEDISIQLQDAPQSVKDDVEREHNVLLLQVHRFYVQKQKELKEYAETKLKEIQPVRNYEDTEEKPKNIKSIVKRRPSSSEKKVSFSKSPPHVETFRKIEEQEDEDDEEAVNDTENNKNIKPTAVEEAKRTEPLSLQYTLPPALLNINRPSEEVNTNNDEDELFRFEDVMESPSTEDSTSLSVEEHHAPENSEMSEMHDNEQISSGINISGEETSLPYVASGSAPVAIRTKSWGLEGDGGPPPRLEEQKRREKEEQLTLSMSKLGIPDSVDPSQMSFSQRMEWESFMKSQKGSSVV